MVQWSIDAQQQGFPAKGSRGGDELAPSSQTAPSNYAIVIDGSEESMEVEIEERNDLKKLPTCIGRGAVHGSLIGAPLIWQAIKFPLRH